MSGDLDPALFDVPDHPLRTGTPTATEKVGRGERRRRLIDRRIAFGEHPLGRKIPLHPDAPRDRDSPGPRCGTCQFRSLYQHHNRTYPKCDFGNGIRRSGCESSDVRAWWPACHDYHQENSHD